mgnify:CR=1 FL=1
MNWVLIIDKTVKKQLQKIPKKDKEKIISVIHEFTANPYAGDIEKMEGEKDVWRRRTGSYRVFYEILSNKNIIYVFEVKRRTSTTY